MGIVTELEASVIPAIKGKGQLIVTGIVEEEELSGAGGQKIRRKSMAKGSVENVLTVLRRNMNVDLEIMISMSIPEGLY